MSETRALALESLYLNQPVLGAHRLRLTLKPVSLGHQKGLLLLDPNRCTLDLWGDPQGCTKIAVRTVDVEATAMRTLDTHQHGRMHHALHLSGAPETQVQLIEYARVGLWYLVHQTQEAGAAVVPLFPTAWFAQPTSPTLGEPVHLKVGEAAVFAGEHLKVEFLAVTEDSRCPTGAVCVWAGQAKVSLRATAGSAAQDFTLTLSVSDAAAASADVLGYRMTLLSLLPHPAVNSPSDPAERAIELRVCK